MDSEYQHHAVYPLLGDRRVRKDPDQGARTNSVPMRRKLWKRLPTEIVERVLLFLPAVAQSRLQLVCKAWRLLLTSPGFREKSTSQALAYHRLCLLHERPEEWAKVDHPRRVDLRSMPAKFQPPASVDDSYNVFGFFDSDFSWVWQTKRDGELCLCLVNLEKRTCTVLPPLSLLPLGDPFVHDLGEVTQEPGGLFFHIPVLLGLLVEDEICVVRYSSRGGVWTTCWLRWTPDPELMYFRLRLYKDTRVFVLFALEEWLPDLDIVPAHLDGKFWQLACFSTQHGGRLARGFLPSRFILLNDFFVAHSRGLFCIRESEARGKAFTVSIFSWTIMLCDGDEEPYSDELSEVPTWRRVSVLTAKHLDPEMRGQTFISHVQINDTILILSPISGAGSWPRQANGNRHPSCVSWVTMCKRSHGVDLLFNPPN